MPGILVGYCRTSTCDQQAGLDAHGARQGRRGVINLPKIIAIQIGIC